MSAAAKAEARRKAILSRGNDRLSRLTTSARGDDAPQFVHTVDPPPPSSAPQGNLASFIGEDPVPSPLVSDQPPRRVPDPHTSSPLGIPAGLGSAPPDPSAWSNEQQQQFLQALFSGPPHSQSRSLDANASDKSNATLDDPLLALMSTFGVQAGVGQNTEGISRTVTESKPKTAIPKLLPLLHVISVWGLVAVFIFWREPEAFRAHSVVVPSGNIWPRWARLAHDTAEQSAWGIEIVPFFWAFVSLELALNSTRIFFDFDSTQPPLLLTLTLPYLPKPLPSMIIYGLKYVQLFGMLVDGLAAAVVAMGLFIAASGIYENWPLP